MPDKNKIRELQNLNHIISEAYVDGMGALERVKSTIPAGTYRQLKAALSKSYEAGRKVVKMQENR